MASSWLFNGVIILFRTIIIINLNYLPPFMAMKGISTLQGHLVYHWSYSLSHALSKFPFELSLPLSHNYLTPLP
jgi:hypothetical protein